MLVSVCSLRAIAFARSVLSDLVATRHVQLCPPAFKLIRIKWNSKRGSLVTLAAVHALRSHMWLPSGTAQTDNTAVIAEHLSGTCCTSWSAPASGQEGLQPPLDRWERWASADWALVQGDEEVAFVTYLLPSEVLHLKSERALIFGTSGLWESKDAGTSGGCTLTEGCTFHFKHSPCLPALFFLYLFVTCRIRTGAKQSLHFVLLVQGNGKSPPPLEERQGWGGKRPHPHMSGGERSYSQILLSPNSDDTRQCFHALYTGEKVESQNGDLLCVTEFMSNWDPGQGLTGHRIHAFSSGPGSFHHWQ